MPWEVFKGNQTRAHQWTPEEDRQVLARLVPDAALARQLDRRTPRGIRCRRARLLGRMQ